MVLNLVLQENHVSNHPATVSYIRYEHLPVYEDVLHNTIKRVELTKSWLNRPANDGILPNNKVLTITHVKETPFTRFSEEIHSMTSVDLDGWGSCRPKDPLNSRDKLIEAGFLYPAGTGEPTLDMDNKGYDRAILELVDIQNGLPPWPIENKMPWSDEADSPLTEPTTDLT